VWCDGDHCGRRIRQSLGTRDWARAGRKLSDLEGRLNKEARGEEPPQKRKCVSDAVAVFLGHCEIEPASMKKYRRVLAFLSAFGDGRGITFVDDWDLDALDNYKLTRPLCSLSWQKELQLLRAFFEFCLDRDWIERNPAKKMKMPTDPKPKPREPYSQLEIIRILAACDTFGKSSYERLRAKAMVLLMRFYGLRVSDVATLRKDRIKNDHLFLHAVKNGATILMFRGSTSNGSGEVRRFPEFGAAQPKSWARGWKDEDTLTHLKDWAACAEEVTVRRAAVEGLAHGWKDDPSPEKEAGQPLTLIVNWPALMKQGAAAQ
jgi:hypothetical protein